MQVYPPGWCGGFGAVETCGKVRVVESRGKVEGQRLGALTVRMITHTSCGAGCGPIRRAAGPGHGTQTGIAVVDKYSER